MLIATRPLRIITEREERLLARSSRHNRKATVREFLSVQYLFRFSSCLIFKEKSYANYFEFSTYLEIYSEIYASSITFNSKSLRILKFTQCSKLFFFVLIINF